jgi:hypothetical protein
VSKNFSRCETPIWLRDAADKDRENRAFVADLRRGKRLCA